MYPGDPIVHFHDPVLVSASWQQLYIDFWFATGDVSHMRTVRRDHCALLDKEGRAAVITVILLPSIKGIDDEMRKEVNLRVEDMRHRTLAHATVVLARGFAASIVRSAIAGVSLLMRVPYPHRTFDGVDEGCAWLMPYLAPAASRTLTLADLRRAVGFVERSKALGRTA